MKIVLGLGNPGPEYDQTRHNVGWWVVDRLAYDWKCGSFRQADNALVSEGEVGGIEVQLLKPTTYMNRSGLALASVKQLEELDFKKDLLVVVDDAALEVGRVRFRPEGGEGGHNGLKSVSGVLQSNGYARLRVGVGVKPSGQDMSDWVLGRMAEGEEDSVIGLLPELSDGVGVWLEEGIEAAMNRFNR